MKHHTKLFSLQLCYEFTFFLLITFIVGILSYYIFIEPKTKVILSEIEPTKLYPNLIAPGDTINLNKRIFKYYDCPGEIVTTIRCGTWSYSYPAVAENLDYGFSILSERYRLPQSTPRARSCTFIQTYWHTCHLVPIRSRSEPLLFFTDFFTLGVQAPSEETTSTERDIDGPSNE